MQLKQYYEDYVRNSMKTFEKACLICDHIHTVNWEQRHMIPVCCNDCKEMLELNPLPYECYMPLVIYLFRLVPKNEDDNFYTITTIGNTSNKIRFK